MNQVEFGRTGPLPLRRTEVQPMAGLALVVLVAICLAGWRVVIVSAHHSADIRTARTIDYIVQKDDTLWGLGRKYGPPRGELRGWLGEFARANPDLPKNRRSELWRGDQVVVPVWPESVYARGAGKEAP